MHGVHERTRSSLAGIRNATAAAMAAAPGEVSGGQGNGGVTAIAELTISSLPLETRCAPFPLRQHGGFWLPETFLPGLEAARARFEPRPSDVLLASFPKSGTTWLKALAFATLNRAAYPPSGEGHPLRRRGPHDCVQFLESALVVSDDMFASLPSPRLLSTHLPYSLLPEGVKADSSGCRIVYICRDPKDVLVSWWLFTKKALGTQDGPTNGGNKPMLSNGPYWRHVLEYWAESKRRPQKVLFLRYEEMTRETTSNVRKLAEFMGCPFSGEEEADGVPDAIVGLCSFDHLRSLEVNRNGANDFNIKNDSFYRKGVAGDWANYLSPEMAAQLDLVIDDELRSSGFSFATGGR
ncbi:cytosolic sulfotransferase 12 [Oryza sativa Japonica Group]|nr:cytosolic sulfotransferase 12 [Oryza sativa Japonica Group]